MILIFYLVLVLANTFAPCDLFSLGHFVCKSFQESSIFAMLDMRLLLLCCYKHNYTGVAFLLRMTRVLDSITKNPPYGRFFGEPGDFPSLSIHTEPIILLAVNPKHCPYIMIVARVYV